MVADPWRALISSDPDAGTPSFASWWGSGIDGLPLFLTYSFDTAPADYLSERYNDAYLGSFEALTAGQIANAEAALAAWAAVSGVVFLEVEAGLGDIRFGAYDFTLDPTVDSGSSGFAFFPSVTFTSTFGFESEISGDVFINTNNDSDDLSLYLHEIGHALGLKHPFEGWLTLIDGDANNDLTDDDGVVTSADEDTTGNTVMSYTRTDGEPTELGPLDELAIQFLYGEFGDTLTGVTFEWVAATNTLTQTGDGTANRIRGVATTDIITGGGGDDLIFGGAGDDELHGGAGADSIFGGIGDDDIFGDGEADTIRADEGDDTVDGGAGDDTISGEEGNDSLTGGTGDDTIFGGSGDDRLIPGGFVDSGDQFVSGGGGIDTLVIAGDAADFTLFWFGDVGGFLDGGGDFNTIFDNTTELVEFDDMTVVLGRGPLASDFNLDLSSDILFQNDSGQAAIWLLDGLAQLSTGNVGANPGTDWNLIGSGDFDNDQKSDLVWRSDAGHLLIWTMDGLAHTGTVALGQPDPLWSIKGIGDFNEDGIADILWHHSTGFVAVWDMDDSGGGGADMTVDTFVTVGNPGDGGASWSIIGAGDFDADGASDILWQHTGGNVVIWFMADGGGGVPTHTGSIQVGAPGAAWNAIGIGDFNADGTDDILFQNDSGKAAIWLIDDGEILDSAEIGANPGVAWQVQGALDANGDGMADILWHHDTGAVAIWTMDGLTQIGGAQIGSNPGSTWNIIAGVA